MPHLIPLGSGNEAKLNLTLLFEFMKQKYFWISVTNHKWFLQQLTNDFLIMSNKRILEWAMSDLSQGATPATSNDQNL